MKWITREHVKVDRVACPWLIKKFVDREAEFYFVPPEQVISEANRLNAAPFDVPGRQRYERKRIETQELPRGGVTGGEVGGGAGDEIGKKLRISKVVNCTN